MKLQILNLIVTLVIGCILVVQLFILQKNKGREEDDMAMCYALLIIKGLKNFKKDVPESLKEQVKKYLIAFEAEHLIDAE